MGLLSDVLSGITGVANTAYNLYTNKRDFDYQKNLQSEIFQREDTAVQRRMADLEAAGLNPNLAAGSAASAGSVVARSNTNDVNMGSALDMISAANQIKLQRQEVQNKQKEGQILDTQLKSLDLNQQRDFITTLRSLGFNIEPYIQDGKLSHKWPSYWSGNTLITDLGSDPEKNFLFKKMDYNQSILKNNAAILENDLAWYKHDKIANDLLGLLGVVPGVGGVVQNGIRLHRSKK